MFSILLVKGGKTMTMNKNERIDHDQLFKELLQKKLRTIDDLEVLEKLLKKIVVADLLQEAENVLESAMNKH